MWCEACRQEVPAVGLPTDPDHVVCARCHGRLVAANRSPMFVSAEPDRQYGQQQIDDPFDDSSSQVQPEELPAVGRQPDGTEKDQPDRESLLAEWEAKLDDLDRLLWESDTMGAETGAASAPPPSWGATANSPTSATVPQSPLAKTNGKTCVPLRSSSYGLCWLIIAAGMTLFGCGGTLTVWSFFQGSDEWWPLGLSLYLVGQALLLAAVIFQVEWASSQQRQTTQSVAHLREELTRVEQATTMLASSHSPAAQSFYVHLAQQASPHLLLADLKNQLDLLTMRLANQDRPL